MARSPKDPATTKVLPLHKATTKGRPVINDPKKYAGTIRAFRIASGMNQGQLAEAVGVTKSAVTNWENGYGRPDLDSLVKICAILSVSSDEILRIVGHKNKLTEAETMLLDNYRCLSRHDRVLIDKLMGAMYEERYSEFRRTYTERFTRRPLSALSACAGTGSALSDGEEQEELTLRVNDIVSGCDEIITITGDSMEPDYHSGDRVLIEYTEQIEAGEVGIFIVAGEGMIKVLQEDGLHSLNPKYKTIHPSPDDNLRCVGRVLGVLSKEMLPTKEEQIMIDEIEQEIH